MTTTNFTTSLGLALPTTGDLSGSWGGTVNDYISKYLDTAVAGALTVSTDVTLLKTTNSALGATSSQYAILIASGHVANITVTAPAISKVYLVINKSGAYTVKIRGAGPTTGITVPVSTAALVAWDGADFVLIATTDINSLSNVLAETKGGTGQSSYAVGDLLYASTTTALSKLADVATGNALISGGVGVAPSYGKIGLTTHVSGTLPVANGGTGLTAFTTNRIFYASSTSAIGQSAGLTFDGTNFATTGTSTGTKFIPTGGTATGNGVYLPAANTLAFSTNSSQRAQFNSSGYFKASSTGTYYFSATSYEFTQESNQDAFVLYASSGTYSASVSNAYTARAANAAFNFYTATADGVEQFYVQGDGVIYAQNTTIQSLSDSRLKENVRTATDGLGVVLNLRPVRYDWKTGNGNNLKNQLGFIAQEVETVFPEAVSTWKSSNNPADPYKTVGPGALIPVLVKAIQELAAEVALLKQR